MFRKMTELLLAASLLAGLSAPAAAQSPAADVVRAHYIDVGQADAIFLELPGDRTMLIDAGNNPDGKTVTGYIQGLGHDSVDIVVGTHPHEDHVGGLDDVIRSFAVGRVVMPNATAPTKTFEDVLTAIQDKGLRITPAAAGKSLLEDGALSVSLLGPAGTAYDNLNDYSAVVRVAYGQHVFLFMGDAEAGAEAGITADVRADVLKVGHHGSDTSTSQPFLDRVKPRYAVIQVGEGNSYGHPADVTIDRLTRAGAEILRTDRDGAIVITSDGTSLTVEKKGSPIQEQAPPDGGSKAPAPAPTQPEPPAEGDAQTVYVTESGKKYHRSGCRYLSKSCIPLPLDAARARYEPCSTCRPPA